MSLARTTDPQTSKDAAKKKRDVRQVILNAYARRPVKGWTDFELETAVGRWAKVSPQRVRTCRSELTRAGELVALSGVTRKTPRGYSAQVWVLA